MERILLLVMLLLQFLSEWKKLISLNIRLAVDAEHVQDVFSFPSPFFLSCVLNAKNDNKTQSYFE